MEIIMKPIAFAALFTAFVAAPAVAADTYLGLKTGLATTNFDNKIKTDEVRAPFGMFGGYRINKMLAAEAEFISFGKVTFVGEDARSNAFSLSAVGSVPMDTGLSVYGHSLSGLSLYGKLGLALANTKLTSKANVRRYGITYGFGGQYDIDPAVAVRVGFDHYQLGDNPATAPKGTSNVLSVGGMFKF